MPNNFIQIGEYILRKDTILRIRPVSNCPGTYRICTNDNDTDFSVRFTSNDLELILEELNK
jgi:hypothetical protein